VETPPAGDTTEEMTLVLSPRKVLPGREWAKYNAAIPTKMSEAANKIGLSHLRGFSFAARTRGLRSNSPLKRWSARPRRRSLTAEEGSGFDSSPRSCKSDSRCDVSAPATGFA
jgi:hypothetical protein